MKLGQSYLQKGIIQAVSESGRAAMQCNSKAVIGQSTILNCGTEWLARQLICYLMGRELLMSILNWASVQWKLAVVSVTLNNIQAKHYLVLWVWSLFFLDTVSHLWKWSCSIGYYLLCIAMGQYTGSF